MANFLQTISDTLTNLGYTCKISAEPSVKEWDVAPPLVNICPLKRELKFMGTTKTSRPMGYRSVTQTFEITYVNDTPLDFTVQSAIDQFKTDLIDNYHGLTPTLHTAGAWDSRVEDTSDYRRSMLPQGYVYSSMTIKLRWIENPD